MIVFAVLAFAGPAAASNATYVAAHRAWTACFDANAQVPEFPDEEGTSVTRTANGFLVEASGGGSGAEAVYAGATIVFQPKGCVAAWARWSSYDGAFASDVRIGWIHRGAPNARELAVIAAAPARPDAPESSMSRAWLGHVCAGGPDSELVSTPPITGPIAPAQPWHDGRPQKSPKLVWSVADMDAIHAHAARPADDSELLPKGPGPELVGVIVPGLDAPKRTFTAGAIDVYEAALPGRNGGRAIALYDHAAKHYRWVLLTRGCVQGTTVKWLGANDGKIIGVTQSIHGRYARGDGIVILDPASGTAWVVALPAALRDLEGTRTAVLAATSITFTVGTVTAKTDLAAALAAIP